MAIPLISNVGFTEVSSSGVLNDKASTGANKLPIQLFKLSGAISGNLQMNNDAAHKKIILDTNGNNILNSSGSPITNNSSTSVELIGSGNVQSTLKTFTSSQSSTSNTGTTTISAADNSTIVVSDSDHTFIGQLIDDNRSSGSGPSFGDGSTSFTSPSGGGSSGLVHETYFSTSYATLFGGPNLTNAIRSDFGMSFTHAFLEDGTPISGALVGVGGPSTFDGVSAVSPTTNTTHSVSGTTYRFLQFNNCLVGVNNGNAGNFSIRIFVDTSNGKLVIEILAGTSGHNPRGAFNQIKNVDVFGSTPGRRFTFTNNLAQSCVLTGNDPYDSVTVSAGSTAVSNRDSTDGSFSLTGTISGTDGSSQPFALKPVNDGSGSIVVSSHTGTRSVSAL